MMTGDIRPTAEAIEREAGVDEVLADLLPVDKVAANEAADMGASLVVIFNGLRLRRAGTQIAS
jgi:Cu+-exporting ATPase